MEKTWKPVTGGILAIIAGAGQVILGLLFTVLGGTAAGLANIPGVFGIFSAIGIPILVLGAVAIAGGIYALKRRLWGLALAGSICAVVGPWILGIPAIIFVAMGKKEFS